MVLKPRHLAQRPRVDRASRRAVDVARSFSGSHRWRYIRRITYAKGNASLGRILRGAAR